MKPKIILASRSPRRSRILKECGIPFKIHPSNVEEITKPNESPRHNVIHNARLKAKDVAKEYSRAYVLGVDTVVSFRGTIIGKPRDLAEAEKLLHRFSGHPLTVYSGICIVCSATHKSVTSVTTTKVRVKKMSSRMRKKMLDLLDPLDRAGGFSIEGIGSFIFDTVEGSFYNVLGLPMNTVYDLFKKIGVDLLDYL